MLTSRRRPSCRTVSTDSRHQPHQHHARRSTARPTRAARPPPAGSATARTNPGTCNDTFGTRVPATGGADLGAGNTDRRRSRRPHRPVADATYYFCAIGSNSVGTRFGSVLSFVAPADADRHHAGRDARHLDDRDAERLGEPERHRDHRLVPLRAPPSPAPATTRSARARRRPAAPRSAPARRRSRTRRRSPACRRGRPTTSARSRRTGGRRSARCCRSRRRSRPGARCHHDRRDRDHGHAATLNGTANPNGAPTTGWFRYATTNPGTCNDTFGTRAPATRRLERSAPAPARGLLAAGHRPHARRRPTTSARSPRTAAGLRSARSCRFTTPRRPRVTTRRRPASAAPRRRSTARRTRTAPRRPAGSATPRPTPALQRHLRHARAADAAARRSAPGDRGHAIREALTGLAPGTTYYFCAIAQNGAGTAFGAVLSFITPLAPTVVTLAASGVSSTIGHAQRLGEPERRRDDGLVPLRHHQPRHLQRHLRHARARQPAARLGAGSGAVAYAQALTGLTPNTTYYYCAIASNAVGTAFGAVLSFTTPAPPSVTTAPRHGGDRRPARR